MLTCVNLLLGAEQSTWHLPVGVTLMWRCWGEEAVVFNEASGQTHLLDAFSEWVLREIERLPDSFAALAERLVKEADLEENLVMGRLQEVLAEFDKQGLAELD